MQLQLLFDVGSLGGKGPKANVQDLKGVHWTAKLPKQDIAMRRREQRFWPMDEQLASAFSLHKRRF